MTHISRSGKKIRNLVESNGTEVCISDVFKVLMESHEHLLSLEYGDIKTELSKAKSKLREARKTLEEFEKRMRTTVQDDVFLGAKHKNKNVAKASIFNK